MGVLNGGAGGVAENADIGCSPTSPKASQVGTSCRPCRRQKEERGAGAHKAACKEACQVGGTSCRPCRQESWQEVRRQHARAGRFARCQTCWHFHRLGTAFGRGGCRSSVACA